MKTNAIRYGTHEVYYSEGQDKWVCDALDLSAVKLSELKAKIDHAEKLKRKFKPFEAWREGESRWGSRDGLWIKATVTSFPEIDQAWITVEGNRMKDNHLEDMYPVTPETTEAIATLNEIKTKITQLAKAAKQIKEGISETVAERAKAAWGKENEGESK